MMGRRIPAPRRSRKTVRKRKVRAFLETGGIAVEDGFAIGG